MKTPRPIVVSLVPALLLMMVSCRNEEARMAKGFRLPEGDIQQGQAAFLQMNCHQCHTVAGLTLPNSDSPSKIAMQLGGEVRKVKSYGELVTSIIKPQHIVSPEYLEKLGEAGKQGAASPMPSYNDTMTVTQMTNIVSFLHSRYQKTAPQGAPPYPYYFP
jgi:L-cysteine S-thiosulfotransferase